VQVKYNEHYEEDRHEGDRLKERLELDTSTLGIVRYILLDLSIQYSTT
jgi:hypothetical protein